MKKTIIFTKDFANREKGETLKCDSMLASHLVNRDKVAKYKTEKKTMKTQKNMKTSEKMTEGV